MTKIHEPAIQNAAAASNLRFALVIAAALVLLALQAQHYFPFIADDAFISLRYSQRLIEGKGLTWSDSQHVEGYTNLLWVLLCAGLGKLGIDLVFAARLLGILCTLSAFAALVAYLRAAFEPARRTLAALCSLMPFALSSSVAVWMIGGLEQTLLIALLGWALVWLHRFLAEGNRASLLAASALLAGVTLTRADGFIFPLLLFIGLVIALAKRRQRLGPASLLLVGPALAYLGQLAFRLAYYHEWLPNTAYVKVSFTLHRLVTGMVYVVTANLAELSLVILAILGCVQLWRNGANRVHAILFLLLIGGTSAYLVVIGGDIFPAIRLFLPVILMLCFAAAHASGWAWGDAGLPLKPRMATLVVLALLVAGSRVQAARAIDERWEFQNRELGLYLKQHLPPNAVIVADAAGAIPFYSGLEAIDPLGLNDHHIAHMASATRGQGFLGHELGDGKYVLDHHPNVIIFGPSGVATPIFPSDHMIASDPRFASEYQLERWAFTKPTSWVSEVYVRRSHNEPAPAKTR
jgi:hypothetical protein